MSSRSCDPWLFTASSNWMFSRKNSLSTYKAYEVYPKVSLAPRKMHCFRVLVIVIHVLIVEVFCDFEIDNKLLEDYDEFQRVPAPATTSNKLQKYFISTGGSSRMRRQLRGNYDIIYIIDSSSSITRAEFRKGIKAIQILIDRAALETRHAVITVASQAQLAFNFTSGEQAKENLEKLERTGGKTNMQDALAKSLNVFQNPWFGSRVGSFRRVMVVTDGQSNIKRNKTIWNAKELKLNGVEIFVVGIGEYLDGIDELARMATTSDAHLYRAGDMQGFVEIVKLIVPVSYRRDWAAELKRMRETFIVGRY